MCTYVCKLKYADMHARMHAYNWCQPCKTTPFREAHGDAQPRAGIVAFRLEGP